MGLTRNQEFGLVVLGLAAVGLSGSLLFGGQDREAVSVGAAAPLAQRGGRRAAPPPSPSPEVASLVRVVDEYLAGAAVPLDFTVEVSEDFFKGALRKTYVPYTLAIQPSSLQTSSVLVYVRVVEVRPPAPRAPAESATGQLEPSAEVTSPAYAFEDVHVVDVRAPGPGQPARVSRALAVAPGDYDLYIAVRERGAVEGAKTSVLKQHLTVPDLFSGLATSSVVAIERMGLHPTPLSEAARRVRPYAMGTMEIVPAWRGRYAATDTLSLFFIVYNPSVAPDTGKPNVTVDYDFYRTADGTETFFNRTPRLTFDADTLPPEFDLALGHQLVAERSIPLQSFPAGDYRVDILVNDRVSSRAVRREVPFSVEPPSR